MACPTLLLFQKVPSPLVIVHPRPGARHVGRPSVVMILVSSSLSFHTCDESKILTKPLAGIPRSSHQSLPISSGVSCSRGRRGSYAVIGIEGTFHRILLHMNSKPFSSIRLLTMSGWCVATCLEGSISYPRRCKTSSVGQSAGLVIPRSSVRFW